MAPTGPTSGRGSPSSPVSGAIPAGDPLAARRALVGFTPAPCLPTCWSKTPESVSCPGNCHLDGLPLPGWDRHCAPRRPGRHRPGSETRRAARCRRRWRVRRARCAHQATTRRARSPSPCPSLPCWSPPSPFSSMPPPSTNRPGCRAVPCRSTDRTARSGRCRPPGKLSDRPRHPDGLLERTQDGDVPVQADRVPTVSPAGESEPPVPDTQTGRRHVTTPPTAVGAV
jgi:hypothetical protein